MVVERTQRHSGAYKPGTVVSTKARFFGDAWAKEKFGTRWTTARCLGKVVKQVARFLGPGILKGQGAYMYHRSMRYSTYLYRYNRST